MSKNLFFNKTVFLKSSYSAKDWVNVPGIEFVFTGYTNVGKSSTINSITNKKKLAYIGKKPGCTQLINFFEVCSGFRLIDLPGYGYSNISKNLKKKINDNIFFYLNFNIYLKGIILFSDIRNPMKNIDIQVLKIIKTKSIFSLILLTKADKIKKQKIKMQVQYTKNILKNLNLNTDIIVFSNHQKEKILFLKKTLFFWRTLLLNN